MKKEIINSNWQFWPDESPFELVAAMPPSARTVTLPHDAMFHEPQREDSLSKGSTGFLDGGAYKYHKSFFVPEDWKGGKVALCFEGVYRLLGQAGEEGSEKPDHRRPRHHAAAPARGAQKTRRKEI